MCLVNQNIWGLNFSRTLKDITEDVSSWLVRNSRTLEDCLRYMLWILNSTKYLMILRIVVLAVRLEIALYELFITVQDVGIGEPP